MQIIRSLQQDDKALYHSVGVLAQLLASEPPRWRALSTFEALQCASACQCEHMHLLCLWQMHSLAIGRALCIWNSSPGPVQHHVVLTARRHGLDRLQERWMSSEQPLPACIHEYCEKLMSNATNRTG